MQPTDRLRALVTGADAMLWGRRASIWLGNMAWGSALGGALESLHGASVLLRTADPLFTAIALIELDGVAGRIVIAPSDLPDEHLPSIIAQAGICAVVSEDAALALPAIRLVRAALPLTPLSVTQPAHDTEWVLFTSAVHKMVAHTLVGLTGATRADALRNGATKDAAWGTFHDIRRHGGLQIFLRALMGRAPLILTDAREETGDFLVRLGRHGVTHLSGTPSHWRRALSSPACVKIAPASVRLSGEIADQAILDSLKARFPAAQIAHSYVSSEAGVGFEVTDGREGFPASLVGGTGAVEMKVADGTLRIRSPRTAKAHFGNGPPGADGFVDTGDRVELWDGRYFFTGRGACTPEKTAAVKQQEPA